MSRFCSILFALFFGCSSLISSVVFANNSLINSARQNDADTLKTQLEALQKNNSAKASVNSTSPDGSSALLWAVYNSSEEMTSLLLAAGADPNIANNLDISPLLQAARNGETEILSLLLKAGAQVLSHDLTSEPVLLAGARSGSLETVKLLLENGAPVNLTEAFDQQSALMWAVAAGHHDVAKFLLDHDADPNLQTRVNELTKRKNADFTSGGFAALHWAVRNGDLKMIDLLVEHGAALSPINGDSVTPLMLAVVNDRLDVAAYMLELGADANDGSLYYATVMRDATTDWRAQDGTVYRHDFENKLSALELTRRLLEKGADPNKPFIGQMHNASMCCDVKVNVSGFYRAAEAADIAGMELMLQHGADVNWKPESQTRSVGIDGEETIASRTALMAAIRGGNGVGVDGGPNDLRYGPPPYREEGVRSPEMAVDLLLRHGADVTVAGPDGDTALHYAVKELNPTIIRALVAHGAQLDQTNNKGETALDQVRKMPRPSGTPGFYFEEPPAWPEEIVALLEELQDTQLQARQDEHSQQLARGQ